MWRYSSSRITRLMAVRLPRRNHRWRLREELSHNKMLQKFDCASESVVFGPMNTLVMCIKDIDEPSRLVMIVS